MLLKSFCGVMSLTAGMVILGFCCLMIAFIALISNLSYLVYFEIGIIFVIVFIVILSLAGILMITATVKENSNIALFAFVITFLALIIFVVGSVISLANQGSMLEYVCVHMERRCPETMWGASIDFRTDASPAHNRSVKGRVYMLMTPIPHVRRRQDLPASEGSTETTEAAPSSTQSTPETVSVHHKTPATTEEEEYEYSSTIENEGTDEGAERGYKIGPQLIAAAIVCAIHFIFLVFCALTAFSYNQELHYFAKLHLN